MHRREFITLLGGVTAGWPVVAPAQQPAMPVIGFLNPASAGRWTHLVDAFRDGLSEMGYDEGQNVVIEFRWADGQYDQLPAMANDLVRRKVAVLVSTGGVAAVRAAKAATSTIPVVFTLGTDPVEIGLVASLNRPGGNVTGINMFTAVMDTKRLGLLHDIVPGANLIAALINPNNPPAKSQTKSIQEAARAVGREARIVHASTEHELDAAFAGFAQLRAGALAVAADPFFLSRRSYIVALAVRYAIPAIYEQREFPAAGGLMSYGTDLINSYRQAGIYTGRILKGDKPADLPVMQSTKFEFVINLKAAKALGVNLSDNLLSLADEVIE